MALAQEWPLASGLPISGWHPEPGILSLTRSSVALVWFLQVAYGECTRCSAWQRAGVRERRWRDGRTIRRSVSGSGRTPSSYAGVEEDFDVGDAFEALDDEAPRPAGDTPAPARPRRQPVA